MRTNFKKKLHVLVVENNPLDERVITAMLKKTDYGSFSIAVARTFEEAQLALTNNSFHAILLDLNLPDSKGLLTLKKMHKLVPDLAIVVNTGAYQDTLGLKAVTQGAQDYLIKGKYKPYTLSKSLYYAVERKKTELDLKKAYNQLKEMQCQLIQAEKMNVIGGIASGIAHEVKNPLATIMYGIEFLNTKCSDEDDKIQLTLQSITDAAKKANEIVKDLLDFAGISNLKKSVVKIEDVIEEALKLTKHQCEKKHIQVIKNYSPSMPSLKIDKNRIEQAMVDIILNSIHAMDDNGKLTIVVYTQKLTKNDIIDIYDDKRILKVGDDAIIVEIDDNGPGISAENLRKVFDPFFTTRRGSGGVGLGLSIARTIMMNHNGAVTLQNKPQGGAQARLIFKL